MSLSELGNAQYIALETFRKNGEAVNTPVWVIGEADALYAVTGSSSWKVKRIRNNPEVRVATSDSRGTPEGEWHRARADVLVDEPTVKEYVRKVAKKYGLFGRIMMLWGRIRSASQNCVVRIELASQ